MTSTSSTDDSYPVAPKKGFLILFLTVALLLTGAVFTLLVREVYKSHYVETETNKKSVRIKEICGEIVYLDDVLTMSAQMAAATGNSEWEKRYREFEPQLVRAIEEAEKFALDLGDNQTIGQTAAANAKLVEMENRAFTLIRGGRAGAAQSVLDSGEYTAQKKIYADGIHAFVAKLEKFQNTPLNSENESWLIILVAVTLVFSLLAWLATVRSLFVSREHLLRSVDEKEQGAKALLQSETRFRELFENANDIIFTTDLQENFTSFNKAGELVSGYTRDELLKMKVPQIIAPESIELVRRMLKDKLKDDAATKYEAEIITKSGNRVTLEINSRLIVENGAATGIQGIARDVTESKQAAADKIKAEQYQNLFKHANDAILIFEPDSEIILEVSDRACEMYGRRREDFVGRSLTEMSLNVSRGTEELEKLLHDGVYDEFESVHLCGDGTPLHLVINAAVIEYQGKPAILTINRDVGQRKRMEEEVREREQHLLSVTNSAQDAIVSADNRGNIIFWNEGARKIFGYEEKEVIGKSLSILMPERYREAHAKGMRRYSETGEKRVIGQVVELEGLRKDGGEFPLELSLGVWETAKGKYFSGILRDVTESRKAKQIEMFRSREVALRAQVSLAFAEGGESLQTNLTRCAESIVNHLDAAFARIWTFNEQENVLELETSAGIYTHINGAHARVPVGKFKVGRIAEERQPYITNDVANDERTGGKEWARENQIVAFAGYPLLIDGKLVGVVAMFAQQELVEETIDALGSVADIIAQNIERKRANEALKQSERQYRLLGEGIMHQVWTAQPDGTLDYVNRQTLEYFGHTRQEVGGVKLKDIIHPKDFPRIIERWKRSIETGEPYEIELRLERADGEYIWFMSRATAGRDANGEIIKWFGTNTDIHDQKMAEDVLRESEERFRLLVEGVENYAIFMLDPNGYIVSWNAGAERVKQYKADEVIGKHFSHFYTQEDRDRQHPQDELRIATSEGRFEEEGWRVRKDGSRFLANVLITAIRDKEGKLQGFSKITRDITERKQTESALRESEYKLRTLLANMSEGLLQVDNEERIEYVNDRFCEMTGYTREELLGKVTFDIIYDDEGRKFVSENNRRRQKGSSGQYELNIRKKNGELLYMIVGGVPIVNAAAEIVGTMGVFTDITERKRAEEQLLHDAFHDGLTGLANRTLFMDHLQMTIERGKRNRDLMFAVLFLDFDRFKVINDSLGHSEGDNFLRLVARRLESVLRPGDLVARLGGDEFTILLSELGDENDAVRVAERVQSDLKKPFDLGGREIYISASIGITLNTAGHHRAEDMLRDADIAMYRAKAKGRAQHQIFDRAMHEHASSQLQLETEMRQALEREEFKIYYQPIMNLETETLVGFEALVRWQHPERGIIPPFEFIPAAEENGLILPLGQWILRESCRQLRRWQNEIPAATHLTVSVNLSSKQFVQFDLAEQIAATLKMTGLEPRCLKLEITESHLMENSEAAIAILKRLRALGVELSLDDFGTGYSSLSYLHRLPVNYLKVDRSFVIRMTENEENSEIVSTIIKLAQNLKMKVVAEGIETPEQLAHLKILSCEYGQGYFFAKPLEAKTAEKFIEDNSRNSNYLINQPVIYLDLNT